jgi:hypothetical protein
MAGHGVRRAAFLAQAHPQSTVLRVDVLHPHPERCVDARDGIDHQSDQGAVPQSYGRRQVDAVEQLAGLGRLQHWGLALLDDMLRTAHQCGRIDPHDLARH